MCTLLKFLQLAALLAALAWSGATAADDTDDSNMIVGGSKVHIEDVPYQAALFHRDRLTCGGTVIGPRWILTSYHCVQDLEPTSYSIVVGTDNPLEGVKIPVKEIFVPAELFEGALYDVALLQLPDTLIFDEQVQCLKLLHTTDALVPGKPATISGFGTSHENGFDFPLKAATIELLPASLCVQAYPDLMEPQMICAGFREGKVDSCQGDSGGPLVVDGKLAGIVFFGRGCGRPHNPGVYMAVPFFYDWIMSIPRSQIEEDDRKVCGEFTHNYP
ncbi:trypsin 3A1-like [Anopheles maculipalpis]|uniref:trypsin 3A1-like n=1 Tax=Anopheles maculipalpis TaxID=1496333 RepID=UPI002158BCCD|nr:trypsin 3A1-like [Anopheles maculipalpis]